LAHLGAAVATIVEARVALIVYAKDWRAGARLQNTDERQD
jgi:hypothetical protein